MMTPVHRRLRYLMLRDGKIALQKEFQNYFAHIGKHMPAHDQINTVKPEDLRR